MKLSLVNHIIDQYRNQCPFIIPGIRPFFEIAFICFVLFERAGEGLKMKRTRRETKSIKFSFKDEILGGFHLGFTTRSNKNLPDTIAPIQSWTLHIR